MPPLTARATRLRAAVVALVLAAACAVAFGAPSPGRADVAADREAAASLKDRVAAETARIEATGESLAAAESRLGALEERVATQQANVQRTQDALFRARVRQAKLERRAASATKALAKNLVADYQSGRPDLVTVIIDSTGFSDLIERADFYKRVRDNNGRILDRARTAKAAVVREAKHLTSMRTQYRAAAAAAATDRNRAAVVRSAILSRQEAQLAKRDGTRAQLATVRGRIKRVERQQAREARAARSATTSTDAAPPVSTSGGGGDVVSRVVSAANEIATLPYQWGGGHGSFQDSGYDCSGSISYALAAGGLLSSPLDSTGFMSWGEAGPGKRITVYANAGHAYMYVDGRRYDTSALSGGGTRWTSEPRSNDGFVARHPPGL
jgi:cell wall-associated NlpC family hydrolase